jgi:hypothetical protein
MNHGCGRKNVFDSVTTRFSSSHVKKRNHNRVSSASSCSLIVHSRDAHQPLAMIIAGRRFCAAPLNYAPPSPEDVAESSSVSLYELEVDSKREGACGGPVP